MVDKAHTAALISMKDMALIFEVTDALGINRENLSVSLEKRDPGEVAVTKTGEVEVVIPLSTPLDVWLPNLKRRLEEMGIQQHEEDEETGQ